MRGEWEELNDLHHDLVPPLLENDPELVSQVEFFNAQEAAKLENMYLDEWFDKLYKTGAYQTNDWSGWNPQIRNVKMVQEADRRAEVESRRKRAKIDFKGGRTLSDAEKMKRRQDHIDNIFGRHNSAIDRMGKNGQKGR